MSERQSEVDERGDTILVQGEDEEHVLPPTQLDPFTPEPRPEATQRRALWLAVAVLAVVVALVLYAALR